MCRQGSFTKERSGLCGCGTALLDRGAAWRARLVFTGSGSGRFPAFGVQVDAGGAMPPMLFENGYQIRMPSGGKSPAPYPHPCPSLFSVYLDYPVKFSPEDVIILKKQAT